MWLETTRLILMPLPPPVLWVKGACFSTHIRRRPAKVNQSPQLRLLFRSSICVQLFGCHRFGREGMDTIPRVLVTIQG